MTSETKIIPVRDRNGHAFDKRTMRCIHCGIGYWEAVAEAVKEQQN